MVEAGALGPGSPDDVLSNLWRQLVCWCGGNKFSTSFKKLTMKRLGRESSTYYPELSSKIKGYYVKILTLFVATVVCELPAETEWARAQGS